MQLLKREPKDIFGSDFYTALSRRAKGIKRQRSQTRVGMPSSEASEVSEKATAALSVSDPSQRGQRGGRQLYSGGRGSEITEVGNIKDARKESCRNFGSFTGSICESYFPSSQEKWGCSPHDKSQETQSINQVQSGPAGVIMNQWIHLRPLWNV